MSIIKLKHKDGYFGTPEVISEDGEWDAHSWDYIPYYLEFTNNPFKLVAVHLTDEPNIDLSVLWSSTRVNNNISDGDWVAFE